MYIPISLKISMQSRNLIENSMKYLTFLLSSRLQYIDIALNIDSGFVD